MSDNGANIWTVLGRRWTLPILKIIGSAEQVRFCEFKKALAGISSTMLSERLQELEHEGLVTKRIQDSKAGYGLTASGRELEFMLDELHRWYVQRKTCPPLSQISRTM